MTFQHDIEVFLTVSNVSDEDVRGRTAVVIDVLRASTTIIHALAAGAREVIPAPNRGEAGRIAAGMDPARCVLGGEKDGKPIEGFGQGNSPLEYTADLVGGKSVILSTTNGIPAILAASEAEHVLVGGFVNASAVVDAIQQLDAPVTLICSGWHNRVSLEDTLAAGLLIDKLLGEDRRANLTDTAYMALWQYRKDQDSFEASVRRSNHGRRLSALGHEEDITASIRVDAFEVVPHLSDQRLQPWEGVPALSEDLSSGH